MIEQQSLLTNVKPLSSRQAAECPHCHQKLPTMYPHRLNRVLVSALWKLMKHGPARLGELGLTTSEHGNSNKLRYFGLAVQIEKNETRTGKWIITDLGKRFLRGEASVPARVWTIEGRVVDQDGAVMINDVAKDLMWRVDYAREARVV